MIAVSAIAVVLLGIAAIAGDRLSEEALTTLNAATIRETIAGEAETTSTDKAAEIDLMDAGAEMILPGITKVGCWFCKTMVVS